jgi:hypothetical protein
VFVSGHRVVGGRFVAPHGNGMGFEVTSKNENKNLQLPMKL